MARVKRGVMCKKSHKKILGLAKGFRGRSKNCFRPAIRSVQEAEQHAYKGRKIKKRDYRSLWIIRINAAVRELGYKYSSFINALSNSDVKIDRKVLAQIASDNPIAFKNIVENVFKTTKATFSSDKVLKDQNKHSTVFVVAN
jgi:large subunit ribosomal protein L20